MTMAIITLHFILNFNFIVCVEVDISSKKLITRKKIQENSCDHNHHNIHRSHLSRVIPNVNFRLINSMYQRLIMSYTLRLYFKFSTSPFKNFLLKLWSECQNLVNLLSANTTKWSNTLKQFVGDSRGIVWVCLTIF